MICSVWHLIFCQFFKNFLMFHFFRVGALPDSLLAIDWAQYKRRTKAFAGVVDDFQKKVCAIVFLYVL